MQNKILWVMNICLHYGTTYWTLEQIRNMPMWRHYVVFLNHEPNPKIMQDFQKEGVDIAKSSTFTKALVNHIRPNAIIMSDTDPKRIEGEWPWSWLTSNHYLIYMHHFPVHPWIPNAAIDGFVSKYLKSLYENIEDQMRQIVVAPPVGSLDKYTNTEREYSSRCVIGRVTSDQPGKYPKEQLEIVEKTGLPAIIVGGERYYPQANRDLVKFPPIGSFEVSDLLLEMDIFVYRTGLTETWCRAVTEAMASGLPVVAENRGGIVEQIRDGIDGFLCNNDDEFVEKIRLLANSPELRKKMGESAKQQAMSITQTKFHHLVEPYLIQHVLTM